MQQRPVIGIPTQTLQSIDRIPEDLPASWVMNQRYFHACTEVGAVPWMVPLLDDDPETLRAIYDRLDGIFLPGGVDMDPRSYGCAAHELCGRTDPPRDAVELAFARWAIEDGKPVFGVCRGMQVLNVAAGGSLVQDCGTLYQGAIKHDYFPGAGWARDYLAHPIRIAEGSRLHQAFGVTEAPVNSMHHQGICDLGEGLVATAWATDGLVEALESAREDHFLVGVQWHPEMLLDTDEGTRRLFEAFIEAANQYHNAAMLA
ncbi:gamma-glutamyl-gamma-aminobutyrate hydrolase family protein [Longimicrobium sp.]|uniref:gamma-glutamyl-gamma-aminobutyrate hydrolase family protein n=1 Tax=Longimicrobium sp. TaxID=2029185 RepID=UPI002CCF949E|nr:gamma-glutamyl-gamma-aminobutyrate hydrolase family protein [Longimicrobium sp.]HSU16780.1 gamma-glutamyl-gamma-aminobutyrate hydrolase family protein [Longimicrobium sp.]